jgi:hypothetical protein
MKNMIIIIMIMLTTSACSRDNRDAGVSLSEPPFPIIHAGEKQVPVLYTAYCWKNDTKGKCADFRQPDFAFKDQTPVVVSPGAVLEIDFKTHPPLTPITHVTSWQNKGKQIKLNKPNIVEAPMAKGVYYYVFSAQWKQGDSGFTFQVKVE